MTSTYSQPFKAPHKDDGIENKVISAISDNFKSKMYFQPSQKPYNLQRLKLQNCGISLYARQTLRTLFTLKKC